MTDEVEWQSDNYESKKKSKCTWQWPHHGPQKHARTDSRKNLRLFPPPGVAASFTEPSGEIAVPGSLGYFSTQLVLLVKIKGRTNPHLLFTRIYSSSSVPFLLHQHLVSRLDVGLQDAPLPNLVLLLPPRAPLLILLNQPTRKQWHSLGIKTLLCWIFAATKSKPSTCCQPLNPLPRERPFTLLATSKRKRKTTLDMDIFI